MYRVIFSFSYENNKKITDSNNRNFHQYAPKAMEIFLGVVQKNLIAHRQIAETKNIVSGRKQWSIL